MSLAMYAAPFDNDVVGVSETPIHKKRNEHQKTQKRYPKYNNQEDTPKNDYYNSEKVNSILKTIHNLPEEDNLTNFEPIPPPESAGVNKTNDQPKKEGFQMLYPENPMQTHGQTQQSQTQTQQQYQGYNPENRFMPNYDTMYNNPNLPYATSNTLSPSEKAMPLDKHDLLMKKINYMITLLEQQQDERTNHVTEEVILYSFLGIFIIFIVDSFARVGKYVR
jgi:hypothetical protein